MSTPGPDELLSVARIQAALALSESRLSSLCSRRDAMLDCRAAAAAAPATKGTWMTLGGDSSAAVFKLRPADALGITGRALAALEAEIGELEGRIEALRNDLGRLPDWLVDAATTGRLPPDALDSLRS